jgi:mono/diheme cytochrome c family protein
MRTSAFIFISAFALVGSSGSAAPVDYVREVKPLLVERCYKCHGASQQKGKLRLDTAASALQGGETGPAFKRGRSAESLIVQAVKGIHPEISRMPYKKPPLSDAQIALIEQWINQGAPAPADEQPERNVHWAFVAPERVALSEVKNPKWARNPIDRFILARLEKEGVAPSPESDRMTLIRRLSLDVLGLPPSADEVNAFLNDARPDACERLVDRLLASPHYGERWGRWWLDAARYADSNGYSIDAPRSIWEYRDWVIDALNQDLPFDQFAIWQLAGDLLPEASIGQQIATGFHRNTQINQEGGIDPEQFRVESVLDRVNTTATVFLGVTLGCAQCHDHKFDPFTQREYYQMFAFFNSCQHDGHGQGDFGPVLELPTAAEKKSLETHRQRLQQVEAELKKYADELPGKAGAWEAGLDDAARQKLKPDAQAALAVQPDQRAATQKDVVFAAFRDQDEGFKKFQDRLKKLKNDAPKVITTLVMRELAEPRETHVFIKGDFTRPGEKVNPAVPAVLPPLGAGAARAQPLNRLDLARWIVATNNPLTARVIVNRVWQQYFGKGIVETENDFGTQGSPPSHPELLDWLAWELLEPGSDRPANRWSLKQLHRLILTSAAYRQSSQARPDLRDIDPNNKLLARQSRLRLDAEIVRDVCLAAAGLLSPKMGGPPVNPPQPDGVMTLGQSKHAWKPSADEDRYRRGIYTQFFRATPHPALNVFDAPDAFSACTRRMRSNTPLQALTLLNDQQFYELAQALGARVLRDVGESDADRLEYAFRLCLTRRPGPDEAQRLQELIVAERRQLEVDPKAKPAEAWTTVARVLLNLDETITRE